MIPRMISIEGKFYEPISVYIDLKEVYLMDIIYKV